ncbi:hydrolase [Virgibacillus soli]|uniref:Hydrolase n=1 Tax=Paracerasibacillus soli TaxID=480284 RepID=A0ABU5CQX2_9BACI|nr:hydrolase [Virgibacillus soli]MDY0408751.1 hydrolase [Virgibacillus soli]
MEKRQYYVNIGTGEISEAKSYNNHSIVIHANQDEIRILRAKLDQVDAANMDAYWRSHIPFIPYHHDSGNEHYDQAMTEVYEILYQLGDQHTKDHIEEMGILGDRPI